ncbi:MAG: CpaF family protein, partial [Caulobacterales bacterium]|nr:CpaF family protein [Caulobacterales bacterium]
MFGKRTATPGGYAPAPQPAAEPAFAPEQSPAGVQAEAFAFGGPEPVLDAAPAAERPRSEGADRLD